MSLALIRAAVHSVLSNAVVLGTALNTQAHVFDYFRTIKSESDINTLMKFPAGNATTGPVHSWMVSRSKENPTSTTRSDRRPGRDPMREFAIHGFVLWGFYSVRDAVGSEKTWDDIVEDVFDAFRANKKLNVGAGDTVIDSGPLQWVAGGGAEGCLLMPPGNGTVLVHYAKLSLPCFEDLGQ